MIPAQNSGRSRSVLVRNFKGNYNFLDFVLNSIKVCHIDGFFRNIGENLILYLLVNLEKKS